jgi:hypothetical protein
MAGTADAPAARPFVGNVTFGMVNGILRAAGAGGKFCRVDGLESLNLPPVGAMRFWSTLCFQISFAFGTPLAKNSPEGNRAP